MWGLLFYFTSLIVVILAFYLSTRLNLIYSGKENDWNGICNDQTKYINDQLLKYETNENLFSDIHAFDLIGGECYFSKNYDNAFQSFESLFKTLSDTYDGNEVYYGTMDVFKNYKTQVGIIYGDPTKYLVHISGIHGAETYAGSAVQLAILNHFILSHKYYKNDVNKSQLPTIIFIHMMNPFGFANNRRVNEENIDLNRNFLTEQQFESVIKRDPNYASYLDLDRFLNPTYLQNFNTSFILSELIGWYKTIVNIPLYGMTNIKRAMVAGNYFRPTGFGYGGFKLAKSSENLIDLLINKLLIPEKAKSVVLIDVHTGLGPSGVDSLLTSLNLNNNDNINNDNNNLELLFPTEYDKTGNIIGAIKDNNRNNEDLKRNKNSFAIMINELMNKVLKMDESANSGYDLTVGTVSGEFCEGMLASHLSGPNRICLTQEFGTISSVFVGKNLLEEMAAYHQGNDKQKEYYGQKLKNSFFVETKKWKRSIVRRGLILFLQGLNHSKSL
eukprot:gene5138-7155_t